jgi:hypothetical protein
MFLHAGLQIQCTRHALHTVWARCNANRILLFQDINRARMVVHWTPDFEALQNVLAQSGSVIQNKEPKVPWP